MRSPFSQLTDQRIGMCIAIAACVCAAVSAPLIRSLPERWSIVAFMILTPLTIGLSAAGLLMNIVCLSQRSQRSYGVALILCLCALLLLAINFFTPWLWPYAQP